MKILVLNGPSLNFLGIREKDIYGSESYETLLKNIEEFAENKGLEVETFQSNHEGDLIDAIQRAYFEKVDGIVINPGAYTHTSIAIMDALKSVMIPCVEVHVSDVSKREEFRQISYVSKVAKKVIMGHGINGYIEAMEFLMETLS